MTPTEYIRSSLLLFEFVDAQAKNIHSLRTIAEMLEKKYTYIFKSSTLEPKLKGRQCSFKLLELKKTEADEAPAQQRF